MWPVVTFSPPILRVISGLLINITAGLILLMFTIKDPRVLILEIIFAIVCIAVAIRLEYILEDYD